MTVTQAVEQFCRDNGLTTGLQSDVEHVSCYVVTGSVGSRLIVRYRNDVMHVELGIPIFVPVYKRPEMAEAVARINWDLAGTFVLDFSDGELRYKTCIPVFEAEINDHQLRWLVFGSINTTSTYSMALMEVASGAATAADAVSRAESNWMEEVREKVEG